MTKPMTEKQITTLEYASMKSDGVVTGYEVKGQGIGTTATLRQLCARRYMTPIGVGHMAFPANADFKITVAGRKALREMGQ